MRAMARKSRLLEIPQKWKDVEDEWYKLHPDVNPFLIMSPPGYHAAMQAKAAKAAAAKRKPARR